MPSTDLAGSPTTRPSISNWEPKRLSAIEKTPAESGWLEVTTRKYNEFGARTTFAAEYE
jgi:hypothetical protein